MPVTVKGSGGGGVTLDAGAAASNTTLTLPNTTGTVVVSDASGNVGIGTSSPNYKLQVKAATNQQFSVGGSVNLANSVALAAINDANNANVPMELRYATTMACYDSGTERMRIDSSGNLQFNSGFGSVATAYGCRAWVSFNGTTASPSTIRGSGNVSSITKTATGDYTVNLTNALPDSNFAAVAAVGDATTGNLTNRSSTANPISTSSVRVETYVASTAALFDNNAVSVVIFR